VGESYNRAYKVVVKVQQLAEMEEVINYKQSTDNEERKAMIRSIWTKRLRGCQRNVEVWQDMLAVHSMVIAPIEDMDNWLKFSNLCRKSGHMRLAYKTLVNLLGCDPAQHPDKFASHPHPGYAAHTTAHARRTRRTRTVSHLSCVVCRVSCVVCRVSCVVSCRVTFNYLRYMYDAGDKKATFDRLRVFTRNLQDDAKLLARCHLTLGQWESELNSDNLSETAIPHILASFKAATEYDDHWYKAWHSWARSNFEVITHYQKQGLHDKISPHLVPAVSGFFRSIALAPQGKSLQDTLRCAFTHADIPLHS